MSGFLEVSRPPVASLVFLQTPVSRGLLLGLGSGSRFPYSTLLNFISRMSDFSKSRLWPVLPLPKLTDANSCLNHFRCTCKPTIERDGKTYPPMTGKADYLPGWATGIAGRLGLLWKGEPPVSDK